MTRVVIVGTSIAGVRTAQALRTEGYEAAITLVGEESETPYDRPPLSKGFLSGSQQEDEIRLLDEAGAAALDIELLLGCRSLGVDLDTKTVALAGHHPVEFDALVVATGATARRAAWVRTPRARVLRTLDDARVLRSDLVAGGDVLVIGAGFIGAEVASTARAHGRHVTIVDPLPAPLGRALHPSVSEAFADLYRRHGVDDVYGAGVSSVDEDGDGLRVELVDGRSLAARTVVLGIGAVPDDAWLAGSKLTLADGVVCDQYCRAIGRPDVFAVGDVARWYHPGYGETVRLEHWTNAVEQAQCVAHNIAHPGDLQAYAPVPYVWSDQHDWKLQIAGRTEGAPATVIGDTGEQARFAALYGPPGGCVSGAVIVNWPRALVECRRALRSGVALADLRDRLHALITPVTSPATVGPGSRDHAADPGPA